MPSVKERSRAWCERFGVTLPVTNAPMADVAGVPLAAAVSECGGLGVLAADFMTPDAIVESVAAIRQKTEKPFAVNLRIPQIGSDMGVDALEAAVSGLYEQLGIASRWVMPDFEAQFEALLDAHVPVLSVTFGGLREVYAERCEQLGIPVIATATTLREAKVLRSSGVSAVVCQGQEAGGPRLNFEDKTHQAVGLLSLIGPAARATGLPVIASGGIATGAQMAASLVAGASAVMIGTALVRTTESEAPSAMKEAMTFATDTSTVLTEYFSGRTSRVLESALVDAMREGGVEPAAYPAALSVMRPIALAAVAQHRPDLMEFSCGFGAALAKEGDAASVIADLCDACDAVLKETL